MIPAHSLRTALASATAATLAVGVLTAMCRGPLEPAEVALPASAHSGSPSLRVLLAGSLGTVHRETQASQPIVSPCDHNDRRQLVVVSVEKQHAWACTHRHTVLSTPVTTGRSQPGDATPKGNFVVEARVANTTLRPANGNAVHVNYWIPFRENIWGFHDAPWQSMPFGSKDYRTLGSLGCVHVPSQAMRQLFHFIQPGATVRIR